MFLYIFTGPILLFTQDIRNLGTGPEFGLSQTLAPGSLYIAHKIKYNTLALIYLDYIHANILSSSVYWANKSKPANIIHTRHFTSVRDHFQKRTGWNFINMKCWNVLRGYPKFFSRVGS